MSTVYWTASVDLYTSLHSHLLVAQELEPVMSSEILLSHVLASEVQSKHQHKWNTSIHPPCLETIQPSCRETPEVLPHNLLLVRRDTVENLTTWTLRVINEELQMDSTYLISVLPPDFGLCRNRIRTQGFTNKIRCHS